MTEQYIIEYADQLNWNEVSRTIDIPNMSDEFFLRFHREIDWGEIISNKTITTEFAHKHEKKIGSKRWYQNGELHREDGPAVIYADGSEAWYQNNKLHRIGGTLANGYKEWYQNGDLKPFKGIFR